MVFNMKPFSLGHATACVLCRCFFSYHCLVLLGGLGVLLGGHFFRDKHLAFPAFDLHLSMFSAIVMILFCFYDIFFCEIIPSTFGSEPSVRWYLYGLIPINYFQN